MTSDSSPPETRREALKEYVASAVGAKDPVIDPDPIGEGHWPQVIDFRQFEHTEDVIFQFKSGNYRVDTSGEKPEFVEVDDDE